MSFIKREELIEEIQGLNPKSNVLRKDKVLKVINHQLSYVITNRTGHWENIGNGNTVYCSECKQEVNRLEANDYCGNCGAKMEY